jgi:hypothetical protein
MPHLARALSLALVSSLLVLGIGLAAPVGAVEAKPEVHPEWGRTATKAHILKRSCRNYRYTYEITPPDGEWGLEVFLVGPGGVHLGHDAMVIGTDPKKGADSFRFCRPSTRPGIFKIRALLSVQAKSGKDYQEGWLPVTRFRLRLAQ